MSSLLYTSFLQMFQIPFLVLKSAHLSPNQCRFHMIRTVLSENKKIKKLFNQSLYVKVTSYQKTPDSQMNSVSCYKKMKYGVDYPLRRQHHTEIFSCAPQYQEEQDKYTMDPGQSSLCQQNEKVFWSKMIFEQKQIRKMHKSYIIND